MLTAKLDCGCSLTEGMGYAADFCSKHKAPMSNDWTRRELVEKLHIKLNEMANPSREWLFTGKINGKLVTLPGSEWKKLNKVKCCGGFHCAAMGIPKQDGTPRKCTCTEKCWS